MSKQSLVLLIILMFTFLFSKAQETTNVFITTLNVENEKFIFSDFKNISKNEGYNNQPFFKSDEVLLYSKNNEGQNDIAIQDIYKGNTRYFKETKMGSEYSPQNIPKENGVATVRLDTNGLQRLYHYSENNIKEMVPNKMVAYYTFFNENKLVASVIENEQLNLRYFDLSTQKDTLLVTNSGRFFQSLPKTKSVSYTVINEEKSWDVYLLNMTTLESFFVCQLPIGIQDAVWYNEDLLLVGSGAQLYCYDLFGDGDWEKIADFSSYNITNITRLALSPNKKHLAFVAQSKN